VGKAVARFARNYGYLTPNRTFATKLLVVVELMVLGLVSLECLTVVERLFDLIPEDVKLSSTILRLALSGSELLMSVLVQCLLAYTTAWVVLKGSTPWAALRDSATTAIKMPLTTFLLVAWPAAVLFPFTFALYEMDLSERDLPPEIMAILLGVQLGLALVLTFLREGSLTRVFLWRLQATS
jgi:hypothetical protein